VRWVTLRVICFRPSDEVTRTKQAGNAAFSFLFGGDGEEYYAWLKYATKVGIDPAARPAPDQPTLVPEVDPARYCPPRRPHPFEPSLLELKGIL
jgi:hypothetical protein